VLLVDTEEEPPVYQQIATNALHLSELSLSDRVIAQRLGVSGKTVGKAIRWLGGFPLEPARGPPKSDLFTGLLDQTPAFEPAEPKPIPAFELDQSRPDFDFDRSLPDSLVD
jgi:hypothetical protein